MKAVQAQREVVRGLWPWEKGRRPSGGMRTRPSARLRPPGGQSLAGLTEIAWVGVGRLWRLSRITSGSVAVGMPVTRHPPHRSVRALLTHTALIGMFGAKPIQRVRVQDCRFRQIPG